MQSGQTLCSQHTPEALALARQRSHAAKASTPAEATGQDGASSSQRRYRRLESTHLASRVVAQRTEGAGSEAAAVAAVAAAAAAAAVAAASEGEVAEALGGWTAPEAAVHLDIGCARGRWVLELSAERQSTTFAGERAGVQSSPVNHLGIEVRCLEV